MDSLGIERAILGGYDWGGRAACIVAALWPERAVGLVSAGMGYNIQDIAGAAKPCAPDQEARDWYQYYFHTERGRKGLAERRGEIARSLWKTWSPSWSFDYETFRRSEASFDNPDFVEVVIHSYRHRSDFSILHSWLKVPGHRFPGRKACQVTRPFATPEIVIFSL